MQDENETEPLALACSEQGSLPAVQMLIGAKANVNAADKTGVRAIHRAASAGHSNVIRLLVRSHCL